jgi:hypothetical protein
MWFRCDESLLLFRTTHNNAVSNNSSSHLVPRGPVPPSGWLVGGVLGKFPVPMHSAQAHRMTRGALGTAEQPTANRVSELPSTVANPPPRPLWWFVNARVAQHPDPSGGSQMPASRSTPTPLVVRKCQRRAAPRPLGWFANASVAQHAGRLK